MLDEEWAYREMRPLAFAAAVIAIAWLKTAVRKLNVKIKAIKFGRIG